MTSVYDPAAASALRMIKAKGALLEFTRDVITHDRDAQTNTNAALDWSMYAVGLPIGPTSQFREAAGLVGKDVLQFYIALSGADYVPQAGDKVTHGGKKYALRDVTVYNPDGTLPVLGQAVGVA